tara:strand:- start:28385 stop:29752 length:1368 start_codon:yes stop_codon:yes gene_type:complete
VSILLAAAAAATSSADVRTVCNDVDYTLVDTIELDTSGQYNTFIRCVVAADVDQDGAPDLIASDRFDDELLVLLNDGAGGFLPPLAFEATGGEWNRIVIAEDLNGDGFPDLAISSLQGLVVMLNRGLGESTFWLGFDVPVLHASGADPHWVDAADLDGDGDPDLLVADLGLAGEETGFHYFMNDGAGQFSEGVPVNLGFDARCISIIGTDLDGDDHPEVLVVGNRSSTNMVHVFENLGPGADQWAGLLYDTTLLLEYGACSIRDADFDGDGDRDLLICHRSRPHATLLLNDGAGGLTIGNLVIPDSSELAEPFDANQDGLPDFAVAVKDLDQIKVYVNRGDGSFVTEESMQTGDEPKFLAVADFDLDGSPDVVSADSLPGFDRGTLTLHRNSTTTGTPSCEGDISCDGRVGVDDLLGVISGWGSTGDEPADLNLDGVVGVDDLLRVVSLWGPCDP